VETTGSAAAPQRAKPAAEGGTQSKASSLTDGQKEALFKEFLLWRNRREMQ
jgi:hypothetical protein